MEVKQTETETTKKNIQTPSETSKKDQRVPKATIKTHPETHTYRPYLGQTPALGDLSHQREVPLVQTAVLLDGLSEPGGMHDVLHRGMQRSGLGRLRSSGRGCIGGSGKAMYRRISGFRGQIWWEGKQAIILGKHQMRYICNDIYIYI